LLKCIKLLTIRATSYPPETHRQHFEEILRICLRTRNWLREKNKMFYDLKEIESDRLWSLLKYIKLLATRATGYPPETHRQHFEELLRICLRMRNWLREKNKMFYDLIETDHEIEEYEKLVDDYIRKNLQKRFVIAI
jgi:hypothetical protein